MRGLQWHGRFRLWSMKRQRCRTHPASLTFCRTQAGMPAPLLALAIALAASAALAQMPTSRPAPDFGLMNNDDGDGLFRSADPETSRRAMLRAIDELAGTPVRTHVQCVALGSDAMYYPSKVASVVGWQSNVQKLKHVDRVKSGMDAGIDAIRVMAERAHRNGIKFVPSYRISDAHFAREPEGHYATGKFWVDNHDRFAMKNNRLDFTFDEVRAYRIGAIEEIVDRYGDVMDGFELDFTRHGIFFPEPDGWPKRALITEIVERARAKCTALEAKTSRPCHVIVRVWGSTEQNEKSGMDVADWSRRKLIDVIVPAQLYATSFDMPLAPVVALARANGQQVYPCLYERATWAWPLARDPKAADYAGMPSYRPTAAMNAGAISTYRAMGVDGFELYNYRAPLGDVGRNVARLCAAPGAINGHDREYVVTPGNARDKTFQGRPNIPAKLVAGETIALPLQIGADLFDADAQSPAKLVLRLGFAGAPPTEATLSLTLNDVSQHDGPIAAKLLATKPDVTVREGFGVVPTAYFQTALPDLKSIRAGENTVEIRIDGAPADASLVEVRIGVFYDDPFAGFRY